MVLRPQPLRKLEAIFEQSEVGDECLGAHGLDFRDHRGQFIRPERLIKRPDKLIEVVHRGGARYTRGPRDARQITSGRGRARKPAHREQTFIIENDGEQDEVYMYIEAKDRIVLTDDLDHGRRIFTAKSAKALRDVLNDWFPVKAGE